MNKWLRFQVMDETFNHLGLAEAASAMAVAEKRHQPYRLTKHEMGKGSTTFHDSLREKVS